MKRVFLLLLACGLSAEPFMLDRGHSGVGFKVKHMGISKVNGRFKDFSATIDFDVQNNKFNSLSASIDVSSIDTDNQKRDEHLKDKDFFDVKQYPTIKFEMTSYKPDGDDGKMKGILQIGSIAKEISLDTDINGKIQKDGKVIVGFSLEGKIKRSEFGLGSGFASSLIGDSVDIEIEAEMNNK